MPQQYGNASAMIGNSRNPWNTHPLKRAAIACLAVICLVLGVISLPLPIPTGAILLTVGFALLLTVSRRGRIWFRGFRRRMPWLDRKLALFDHRLPDDLRRALSGRRKPEVSRG